MPTGAAKTEIPDNLLLDDYINSERDWPGAPQATDEFLGDLVRSIQHDKKVDRCYLVKVG